ncbi:large ribosomal subunit protein mL52-like isoform X2 [Porites lutea]|uniref:large ribosomal subunit protein mL52-like isoform X2 n=1 Tax=Porites lutea TaxID=51062 RepID=UPI003CC6BFCA
MASCLRFFRLGFQVFVRPLVVNSNCYGRHWSTHSALQAGQKIRLGRGQAKDGIAYGPLTDLPDWSYADGTPAPETKRQRIRRFRRLDVANQVKTYLEEMEKAAQRRDKEGNILETKEERKTR